jgi:glycosyltransferase involved in cell wall biosynthesis
MMLKSGPQRERSSSAVLLINSLGTGGAERAVALAVAELRARGRDVRILCLERAPVSELTVAAEVEYLSGMTTSAGPLFKLAALPVLAFRLASHLSRHRTDVVMSHLFRANFVNVLSRTMARSRHRAVVVNHTSLGRLARGGTQGWINWILSRMLYPKADSVASVSAGAAAECRRLLDLPAGRSIILHDSIDTSAGRRAVQDSKPKEAIVGVGRLVGLKRYEDLIDAFARIAPDFPRLELRLIGDGPQRLALQHRAGASGVHDRISFLGRVDDPFTAMAGCTAFVSTSDTEGFGMAIVEALALGIPVVASDCAYGPREILAPSTDPMCLLKRDADMEIAQYGILYPVGSIDGLAKALRTLLGNRELRDRLAKSGCARAADFSVERSAAAYERLLFPA